MHVDRDQIDKLYVQGHPLRTIISRFGGSLGSASRHRKHVAAVIRERLPAERERIGTRLIDRVEGLIKKAERICELATEDKKYAAAANAINSVSRALQLLGTLTGEITQPVNTPGLHLSLHRTTIHINAADDEQELAKLIAEATNSFDPVEIQRLKALLAESTLDPQPNVPPQSTENK
jgi:hypothetical protein